MLQLISWSLLLSVSLASPVDNNFALLQNFNTSTELVQSNNTLWDWVSWGIDLLPQEPLKEYLPQGSLKEYLPEYLPQALKNYFNSTVTKGKDLVFDIYDDIVEEVGEKTQDNIKDFEDLWMDFGDRVTSLYESHLDQFYEWSPLTEEQVVETNEELEELKEKLDTLEKKVDMEKREEAALPDVYENQIQKFITAGREMLSSVGQNKEIFFGKMRQTEVELLKFNVILGDASAELKTKLNSFFESMAKIDLQKIGEEDEPRELN